jgi:hypothetical protein
MITIAGTVGSSGKYLVTGSAVNSKAQTPLKIAFENKTGGTNLALWAGTINDFNTGNAGTRLSDSGGPGFAFLTVIDAADLNDQILYVQREVGTADAQFTLSID